MKKIIIYLFAAIMITALAACSQNESAMEPKSESQSTESNQEKEKKETVKLDFTTNASESTLEAYKKLAAKFNEQYEHIQVEVTGVGKGYGALMNAKMASNDLPDIWTTHGWSVHRYSEYLRPLNDQPWASKLVHEIKPIVSDENGMIYVLPFDVDISGLIYNEKILNDLNIAVPKTWEEFLAACEKIKEAGLTPIHIGGKNPSDVAGFLNRIALSLLIAGSDANYGQQLKNGTFDWSNFNQVSEFVLELKDKGFFNVDHLTSDKQGTYNGLAKNEVAFAFQSNKSIYEVLKVNPDAQVTMMRLPSEDGEPFLISGERNAIGVWKDTPHEEEALAFLEFMSKPEHVRAVAETYYLPAAIEGVKVDLGDLEDVFNKYEDARVFHHFDREYLPNGMWGTLKVVGPGVLSKEMNIEQASKIMKEDYERLRNENK